MGSPRACTSRAEHLPEPRPQTSVTPMLMAGVSSPARIRSGDDYGDTFTDEADFEDEPFNGIFLCSLADIGQQGGLLSSRDVWEFN